MFSNLNSILLALCGSMALAQNLRNGPSMVHGDLSGFIGASDSQAHRHLAMSTLMMRELADFDWDVDLATDYPTITFENAGSESEVRFKYGYTGVQSANKYTKYTILQGDCLTPGSAGALSVTGELTDAGVKEYQFDLDVLQETVTSTPEYTDIDVSTAMINFCVRVDYYYDELGTNVTMDSINFHETNVTITIDLTANFTLTAVNIERIDADQIDENVNLDCEVKAYFCDDSNNLLTDPLFNQGDLMTVCVEIADADAALYHLNDVMTMNVEQDKTNNPGSPDSSAIIQNQFATGLSDKQCRNGICNIRHQLASKFFDERSPNDLDIAGVAICAFGPLSKFTRRVSRSYKSTFTAAHTVDTLNDQANISDCINECENVLTNCNSFSVVTDANGNFDCTFVLGVGSYPLDTDMDVTAGSTVYMMNDAV